MEEIRPRTVSYKYTQKVFVYKYLKRTSHLFIRKDRTKKQLELAYDGSFQMVGRNENILL